MRGWFPSNYVKMIEEEEEERILEPEVKRRNTEYRLSLISHPTTHWIPQKTEDGTDTYYYNTMTGAMRIDRPEEEECEDPAWRVNNDRESAILSPLAQRMSPKLHNISHTVPSLISKSSTISTSDELQPLVPSVGHSEASDWPGVFQQVVTALQQLSSAVQYEQQANYPLHATGVVNAIRNMLVASNTVDKDSIHLRMHQTIRNHHRTMITHLSKLVLSAQSGQDESLPNECNDLLSAVKEFVQACGEAHLPLLPLQPQFGPEEASHKRYSLQPDLAENLETLGASIQDSVETMMVMDDVVLLFTHFRNLSSQAGLFLGYLDETDLSILEQGDWSDLMGAKQTVSDTLGSLFIQLQAMTNERADLALHLEQVRKLAKAFAQPIERLCANVLQLANRHSEGDTPKSVDKIKRFFGSEPPAEPVAVPASPVNEKPDFLQHDYGPNEIVFTMEGGVKGGTLPALVERLTMHDYFDMNFVNTFLLTYRSFCTSQDLLDLLEARYNLVCPELTAEERTVWEEKKLKLVRLRVFNVLKNWLELYYNQDDSALLDRLMHFTETHIKSTLKFSNGQLESLIDQRKAGLAVEHMGLKKMVLTLPAPPEPIFPKNKKQIKLMDIDILEMARQLSIMDFKLYSSIRPIECLNKSWSREDDATAVNIRASIEYCNQITSWVSDVILSQQETKRRGAMIKYWVQVAEKCRMLNNFNTCMAILSAFDNSSVGRLKRTWEAVGTRTNQTLQHIRKLMGANRNFTEYRALIHSVNPPCIPFLGIYLQDLTFIEDGNTNELKKNKSLINFAKRAKTAEVIREIQQYQSSLYQLQPVDEIQEFIKSHLESTRDEEQLYNESLRVEPKERDDEKITRLLQESGFL
ncbi:ras guanine nucleotide exchange factor domain-containing protein [Sporodiniella umbellata]|nr:ras guanine nucleotide exchange factor domain-containing protein [Sporodiniella umbellata]